MNTYALKKLKGLPFFILSLIASAFNATAQSSSDNQYIVTHNSQNTTYTLTDVHFISFFELPLWIKIVYISTAILSILALLKIIPFFVGRLKNVLDNPIRNGIFIFIKRNPGKTISELSEEKKVNRGTLKYHLSKLLKSEKIVFIKNGKSVHVFSKNSYNYDKNSLYLYLTSEIDRKILYSIMDSPGISNSELSIMFNLNKSKIHRLLRKYAKNGIIKFKKDGKYKRCYLTNEASENLKKYRQE